MWRLSIVAMHSLVQTLYQRGNGGGGGKERVE
jgi:hypothetical protein